MRRLAGFLLVYSILIIPAVAQRGGRGFRGGTGGFDKGLVGPGYRGGFVYPGFRELGGGFFPGNRFVGFGLADYTAASDYPDDGYTDYSYSNYAPSSIYYGYGPTAPVLQQSPPRVIEYHGPAHTCPQASGKPLYRIAVPADNRERKIPPTYQNNLWVLQDYSFTNGTLNFTTEGGEQKETSIRSVDRALTLQLNRECGTDFRFPQ
jgi:hypothetical protein